MLTIQCLRHEVQSGNKTYPIFVGFAPAEDILRLAEAPSFSAHTSHSDICDNILTPPVKDWQRPLAVDRVQSIATVYNNTGELMPNPVLLCENSTLTSAGITPAQQVTGGVPTGIWNVQIAEPLPGAPKPLWILDGQHRINGLAASQQRANGLPVVLLLNQNHQIYGGPLVAKIFAQVTTAATALDELHNEWLTFAFRLKSYDSQFTGSQAHHDAMQAVAELCRRPEFSQITNPFFNRIRFNQHDRNPCHVLPGGFRYTCIELKELIWKQYYNRSSDDPHLAPAELAEQMVRAFLGLAASVTAPHENTVFFGDAKHEQRIMQDAFFTGVFSHLLKRGPLEDWKPLLADLKFPSTVWDFSGWTISLNGTAGSVSKKLALDVFSKVFRERTLPTSAGNLVDFLRGHNAEVTLYFSTVNSNGKPLRTDRKPFTLKRSDVLSEIIVPAKHFKVGQKSGNVGKLEIIDGNSLPGRTTYYSATGEILNHAKHNNPLNLVLLMHHYGGVESRSELEVRW